jgi:hypothetical protein
MIDGMVASVDIIRENVRVRLQTLNRAEFEQFIRVLDTLMMRSGLNLRDYLVPVGIPGQQPTDLTPYELAHLARFFRLNVPHAVQPFDDALEAITGHNTTSPLTEGSGNELPRRHRAARPHIRRIAA